MRLLCIAIIICLLALPQTGNTQSTASMINKGNEAYRKGDYMTAANLYKEALKKDPGHATARFNLATALQKQKEYESAIAEYKKTSPAASEQIRAATAYNMALAYVRSNRVDEAIALFRAALRLMPDDKDTRENLVKALREKQNQTNSQPKKDKQEKQRPFNKDLMEEKFNQLRNEEKNLQKQLNKKAQNGQPEKDW